MAPRNALEGTPLSTRPVRSMPVSAVPTTAPMMLPYPPLSRVPPITTAAMTSSSRPSPRRGSTDLRRHTWSTPASAARPPQMTKLITRVRSTSTPWARAASPCPPVAKTALPKRVRVSNRWNSAASTSHQMMDMRKFPAAAPISMRPLRTPNRSITQGSKMPAPRLQPSTATVASRQPPAPNRDRPNVNRF